jgi:hypothetical protein
MLSLSAACAPSAFDNLAMRGADAARIGHDPDDEAPEEAGVSLPEDEVDAEPSGPMAAFDAGTGDATVIDAGAAGSDASACVSIARPLPTSPRVTELARLALPSVFGSRVLGPSQRIGAGRAWILLSNLRAPNLPQLSDTPQNHPLIAYDGPQEPWTGHALLGVPWQLMEPSTDVMRGPTMLTLREGELPDEHSFLPLSLISRTDGGTGTLAYVLQTRLSSPTAVWLATTDRDSHISMRGATPLFTEAPFSCTARAGMEAASSLTRAASRWERSVRTAAW